MSDIRGLEHSTMATQMVLPNFTLELHGDMKTNWDYFSETFESYVTLMGYRSGATKRPENELAALKSRPEVWVTLQVYPSDYDLGAALLQHGPVAYCSSTLTDSKRDNYAQIKKDCLAIVHAMNRWDQWLYGHRDILVETDHKPLETIFKHPIASAPKRLQKMMLKLQRYNFSIHHKKGSTMFLADTLSRAPLSNTCKPDHSFEVFAMEIMQTDNKPDRITDNTLERVKEATRDDLVLSHLIPYIQHGCPENKADIPTPLCQFWTYRWELLISNGVIYKGPKVVIHKALHVEMLNKIHAAHQCIEKSI